MKLMTRNSLLFIATTILLLSGASQNLVQAQGQAKWLSVGSLHNFYMPVGIEREHALVARQQYGLRWPALYQHQDMQAAKALWIGTTDFTDGAGNAFPFKVVHAGPRVGGLGAFFPVEHKLIGKYPPVEILVDDEATFNVADEVDEIDPTMAADRMVYTKVNTEIGITMERRVMQFSLEGHDNYHILEYTFTNTGKNTSSDAVTLPNKTLTGLMFFWQYRYSVVAQTRYTIGNATGWGINAMTDRFGDGLGPDYGADAGLRGQFTWHGRFPLFTQFDNIGGPIWIATTSSGFVQPQDTVGRLGAIHFVGNAFLHADTAPGNTANDPAQPTTMTEVGSDDGLNSGNDPFNSAKMLREYNEFMLRGRTPRHAYLVEPTGDPGFKAPTGDPSRGTSGGFSAASGVGPYTLAPGESIRIVKVEAASGLSRQAATEIGRQFKLSNGNAALPISFQVGNTMHTMTKNEWVFTGRDSLMQTFNRAKANFDGGYTLPSPPVPPTAFRINSGGDGIYMDWDYPSAAEGSISGFEIYRAQFRFDSLYTLVGNVAANVREFADTDSNPVGGPIRGIDNYYYIQAVAAGGSGLRSSRYLTQSYDPARLKRQAGTSMDQIRVVPNPFVRSASPEVKVAGFVIDFLEVPGRAKLQIFTELGELVRTIMHSDGSGDIRWNLNTGNRQRIVSGVYIAVIENLDTGEVATRKFVVIM
jgi:hypothetical protein